MQRQTVFFLKFLNGEEFQPLPLGGTLELTGNDSVTGTLQITDENNNPLASLKVSGTRANLNGGLPGGSSLWALKPAESGDYAIKEFTISAGVQVLQDPPSFANTGSGLLVSPQYTGLVIVGGLTRLQES